jgi:hypothetical protein
MVRLRGVPREPKAMRLKAGRVNFVMVEGVA